MKVTCLSGRWIKPSLRCCGLLGDKAGGGDSQLSLQTYHPRHLCASQTATGDQRPDPQEMTPVNWRMTVLQGKTVDLTPDTRDYGRLIAASLGGGTEGFGQALFVRPMEQSWRQVLTPAADSPEPPVAAGDCQPLESGLRRSLSVQSLTKRCLSSCWRSICAMTGASTSL